MVRPYIATREVTSWAKPEMLARAYELGSRYEHDFRGCSQCVIAAIQDTLEIRNDFVYKAGSGLAGGAGGCTDGLCGAVSGSVMTMSSFFGRTRPEQGSQQGRRDRHASARMAAALHDRFIEKYGSVICSGIQKRLYGRSFDLRDEQQKRLFHEAGAHDLPDKCCAVVGDGARWATELILDEIEETGLSLGNFAHLAHLAHPGG